MSTLLSQMRAASQPADCPLPPAGAPPAPAIQPAAGDDAQPCDCGCVRFWKDAYGNTACRSCQPPRSDAMVRESLRILADPASRSGYRLIPDDPAKAAALELAALPPAALCACNSNLFWLDGGGRPRCSYCDAPPANAVIRRRVVARLSGGAAATSASPLFWDDAENPKPTLLRDILSDEEKNYFDELKQQERKRQERAAEAVEKKAEPAKAKTKGRRKR